MNTAVNVTNIIEFTSIIDEILSKVLLIIIICVVGTIVEIILDHHLEVKRLNLLLSAKPEVLALEFIREMKEYVHMYSGVKSSDKPGYVVLRRKIRSLQLNRYTLLKALLFVLMIILLIYLLTILYRG